jgi:MFS family permease
MAFQSAIGLLFRRPLRRTVNAGSGDNTMPLQRRLVLNASCVAMLAVGENSTAIMAALPAISSSLGLDAATAEWAVNAYLVCAAVFIILGGEAADKYGSRRSSAAGIALFALASLVIALAQDGRVLVAARALQGLGAAFAVAGTLAAVTEAAPEAGRAGAISSWTGFLMLGFSLGSLIGGVVTHYAGNPPRGYRVISRRDLLAGMSGGETGGGEPPQRGRPPAPCRGAARRSDSAEPICAAPFWQPRETARPRRHAVLFLRCGPSDQSENPFPSGPTFSPTVCAEL